MLRLPVSHFGILKDAWRKTPYMHAGGRYTDSEAERIFENVKGFMQQLAERPTVGLADVTKQRLERMEIKLS